MVEIISSVERTARKDHEDSAGVWIENSLSDIRSCGELTFGELRSIAKLKANGWKILKGEKYIDSVIKQDGVLYPFKYKPEINSICQKLDMYVDC